MSREGGENGEDGRRRRGGGEKHSPTKTSWSPAAAPLLHQGVSPTTELRLDTNRRSAQRIGIPVGTTSRNNQVGTTRQSWQSVLVCVCVSGEACSGCAAVPTRDSSDSSDNDDDDNNRQGGIPVRLTSEPGSGQPAATSQDSPTRADARTTLTR